MSSQLALRDAALDEVRIEGLRRHLSKLSDTCDPVRRVRLAPWLELEILRLKLPAGDGFHLLVTSGLSAVEMPARERDWDLAELCLLLPPEWPVDAKSLSTLEHGWPVRWMERLALMALEDGAWLSYAHSVPNGEPPQPFAPGTGLCGWLLLPPVSLPPGFSRLRLEDGRAVNLLCLIGVHGDEMEFKLQKGTPKLVARFGQAGVEDVLQVRRPSAMRGRGGPLWRGWGGGS